MKEDDFLGDVFEPRSTWKISNGYCHNEYVMWSKRCYLHERLSSLAWIFLHGWQNSTAITSVVCDHYSSSTGYRVVLHVFKYSYRDSISEQANYGGLAKAMEKALYSCNCKCIGDSDLGKHKPVYCCTGKIPRRKKLLRITVYSSIAKKRRQELHMIIIRKMPQWSRTLVVWLDGHSLLETQKSRDSEKNLKFFKTVFFFFK